MPPAAAAAAQRAREEERQDQQEEVLPPKPAQKRSIILEIVPNMQEQLQTGRDALRRRSVQRPLAPLAQNTKAATSAFSLLVDAVGKRHEHIDPNEVSDSDSDNEFWN